MLNLLGSVHLFSRILKTNMTNYKVHDNSKHKRNKSQEIIFSKIFADDLYNLWICPKKIRESTAVKETTLQE